MLLPPPTLFPVHRTHTRLRLTLLARRLAQNPQPAQKEKGIKKSFKLSGIMPSYPKGHPLDERRPSLVPGTSGNALAVHILNAI